MEHWGRLLAALREHEVAARGDGWLCLRVLGEHVTIAPVGANGVELIAPVCLEAELGAHAALVASRSLAFGALVLVDGRHCLRQVLPLDLVEPERLLELIGAHVGLVRVARAWAAARPRDDGRPFAGYAA
jgi:hypothetical protein